MTLENAGYGAGTRDLPQVPTSCACSVGELSEEATPAGEVIVIETNLDDTPGELVPDAAARAFAAGALDVWTTPVQMKKGRPGVVLAALARPADARAVAEAIVRETTALGVRMSRHERLELERRFRDVTVDGHSVRVKLGLLDGEVVNIAPEHDDCARAAAALGRPVKSVWAAALAAAEAPRVSAQARVEERLRESRQRRGRALGRRRLLARRGTRRSARSAIARSPSPPSPPHSRPANSTARAPWPRPLASRTRSSPPTSLPAPATAPTTPIAATTARASSTTRSRRSPRERGYAALASGANADDEGDWRPGLIAASEHGVVHPLLEAGLGKADVRALAHELGVPSAAKAASPCLASRVPYGTPVDPATLALIDAAEGAVRALGFGVLRVRHHGELGKLELPEPDLSRALADPDLRLAIGAAIRSAGYAHSAIDTDPFKSGNLNVTFVGRLSAPQRS